MAIYAPGKRDRHGRRSGKGKRKMVAMLSLTAMVDMFTVLTVFLLQNYNVDGIQLKQTVPLPMAHKTKKLRPAHVVVIKQDKLYVDDIEVGNFEAVKEQEAWLIEPLKVVLEEKIKLKKEELQSGLKNALQNAINEDEDEADKDPGAPSAQYAWGRVTLQADKDVDFLTVKKVLYSITEAGATMVNFAVVPLPAEKPQESL